MKNMGLSRLRLAGIGSLNDELLRMRAIHAADIWEKAQFFGTLSEAAADCSLLIGTTRRRGRRRKSITMDPRTLAAWLGERSFSGPAAIVFGNERTGLEEAELDQCNAASHIPVSDTFPSLNLSHAVQIYAYELFQAFGQKEELSGPGPVKGEWNALNQTQVKTLVKSITDTLAGLGFYIYPGRKEQVRFLCDLVSRAGLTEREGKYFRDIIAKTARLSS
jgi:tRNA/rRNA methyltransferase/tRNA (cytidine32/uridine32-2'-O)-methyltransferase